MVKRFDNPSADRIEIRSLTEEDPRIALNGEEIAFVLNDLSQEMVLVDNETQPLLRAAEKIALGSSTAIKIWQYYDECIKTGKPFLLKNLELAIRDLDFVYSGDYFDQYIIVAQNLPWLKPLTKIEPDKNAEGLRNYPIAQYYTGKFPVNAKSADGIKVEIFDHFTFGGHDKEGGVSDKQPVFTMRMGGIHSERIVDDDGVSINVLSPAILALQSFLYDREDRDDLLKSKKLIEIYLADENNDIFSLLETAKMVCPHISVNFAKFVFEYLEENNLQESVFTKYFGSKAKEIYKLTREMIDLFDPEAFPYHNFFDHIVKLVRQAKPLLNEGIINPKYAEDVLLEIYGHDSGLNKVESRYGHEKRGSHLLGSSPIASELVKISETTFSPYEGLIPAMFMREQVEARIQNLEGLGVSRHDALELIYFAGLIDISNIFTIGHIIESFNVLREDHSQDIRDKKESTDFVSKKGYFYVSLFKNTRDYIISKLGTDYAFTKVFMHMFGKLNHLDYADMKSQGLMPIVEVKKDLVLLIEEKIELWDYIQERPDVQRDIEMRYLRAFTSSKDPETRAQLIIDFNIYISDIHMRAVFDKAGVSINAEN